MTIKYLEANYENIDWDEQKKYLYGFDIDQNNCNMMRLNILLDTTKFFDTIITRDTLYTDIAIEDNPPLNADVILANEPMGLVNILHAECCDRIKDLKIRGTKAEPLFLQLFMEALNENGRCAVVVPDGVLFNDSNLHQGTRKKLIEEFNLVKVITLNDKEFFLNTGVKHLFYILKIMERPKKQHSQVFHLIVMN